ncbi:hypothetical protein ACHAW6_006241 [Cyclotella cf. meneghiniana]
MFQVFRQTARRAASNSNKTISASVARSSMAAGAAVLLALASGRQLENDDNVEANDPLSGETHVPKTPISSLSAIPATSICQCELSAHLPTNDMRLRRAVTSKLMAAEATAKNFFSLYEVDFDHPLGSGAYGDVYLCRERSSGEECALKKIPKEFTEHVEFQREMNALLHIRAHGGHPNICMLRENFDEEDDYLLVLDLVMGKEMFDHLIEHGAYSEADASRLVRQVASALDFIHGIGVVHADLKPENIMLRSTRGNAFIKLIDFGCSEVLPNPDEESPGLRLPPRHLSHQEGATTAYCPPEAFSAESVPLHPSADMWALGVIVYMMLLGRHPFDLTCDASDEEIGERIREHRLPAFDITRHLSSSAMDLLSKLMDPDPNRRMTAHDMLHHPWVTGETAREEVIEDSAERLKAIHKYKSGIEKSVIESLISLSEDKEKDSHDRKVTSSERRTSLLERAFDQMDKDKKGYLSKEDLKSLPTTQLLRRNTKKGEVSAGNLSFNHFSDLVGQNIRSMHFPRGHVVYHEGDDGDYMYFINSGTLEVTTKDGFKTKIGQGDYFGKGGVLGKKRRTTITCTTPVNVLRLDKELFMKYIVKGSPLGLKLREKINTERFDRALSIIRRTSNMVETSYKKGGVIFREGEEPNNDAYIVKEGLVDIVASNHHVQTLKPGRLFGVQSFMLKRNRKASAVCASSECVIKSLPLDELDRLAKKYPELESTLQELALRQEFRRAIVLRRMQSFPTREQLKEVFDSLDTDKSGTIDAVEVRELMQTLGGAFTDEEISSLIRTMDLTDSGSVDFSEFQSVFGDAS